MPSGTHAIARPLRSLIHRLRKGGPGMGLLEQRSAAVGVAHVQQAFR
ncbi:MAG TPA: hypothetical protein PLI53_05480 [Geobacteraceae bacterium]|nr:hypothetical protein [Geobacteraceae bacterium]